MREHAKVTINTVSKPIARGIKEAAEAVGVSPSFIRKAIEAGDLRRSRVGRRVLIKEEDLIAWLDGDSHEPTT